MSLPVVHVACPTCGAKNRVPKEKFHDHPVCGKCRTPLTLDTPAVLSEESFLPFLRNNDLPVVVDFWATWCAPCRMMAPQFEAAAGDMMGQVMFAKLETESAPQVSGQFGIRSIPTLVVFRQGQEVARISGAMSRQDLVSWIRQSL